MDELYAIIRSIPRGRVASYGTVGEHLRPPTTGRIVGRMMNNCPVDLPWWRVVGWSGHLPIGKKGPDMEALQEDLLREEGVEIKDGKIDMKRFAVEIIDYD